MSFGVIPNRGHGYRIVAGKASLASGDTISTNLTKIISVSLVPGAAGVIVSVQSISGGDVTVKIQDLSGADVTTATDVYYIIVGE